MLLWGFSGQRTNFFHFLLKHQGCESNSLVHGCSYSWGWISFKQTFIDISFHQNYPLHPLNSSTYFSTEILYHFSHIKPKLDSSIIAKWYLIDHVPPTQRTDMQNHICHWPIPNCYCYNLKTKKKEVIPSKIRLTEEKRAKKITIMIPYGEQHMPNLLILKGIWMPFPAEAQNFTVWLDTHQC